MKRTVFPVLALVLGTAAAGGLFVIPDPGAQACDGYVIVYRTPDHSVAFGVSGEGCRVLDSDAAGLGDYALVTIRGEGGLADIAEIGEPVYRDHHSVIVRLSRPVPDPFVRPGIHHVQPLRENRAPAEAIPIPMRSGYDEIVAEIVEAVNQDSLISYTTNYQNYLTRHSSTDGYDTACAWSQDRFEGMGLEVEVQPFPMSGYTCQNVIATQTGQTYPNRYWIICGHLDSTSPNPYYDAPGADDNGSGSATVMEAARIMSGYQFEYTVKYILFGGEEQGLYGSAYYASNAASAGDSILGVVNLDMTFYGPAGNDIAWLHNNTASTGLRVAFQAISDTYVPALVKEVASSPSSASDHASFWNHGYVAILNIERLVYSNPHYHKTSDLIANYIQYFPFGTNMAKASIATVAYLAGPIPVGTAGESVVPVSSGVEVRVSPNPVSGPAAVRVTVSSPARALLEVFDLAGRTVHGEQLVLTPGDNTVSVDMSPFPAGVYILRVSSGGGHTDARVAVVHR